MNQLTLAHIFQFVKELEASGMKLKEISALPIYLGNDDELNGIHCAWYTNLVDTSNPEDADLVEMINEDRCNIEIKGKAIIIS